LNALDFRSETLAGAVVLSVACSIFASFLRPNYPSRDRGTFRAFVFIDVSRAIHLRFRTASHFSRDDGREKVGGWFRGRTKPQARSSSVERAIEIRSVRGLMRLIDFYPRDSVYLNFFVLSWGLLQAITLHNI